MEFFFNETQNGLNRDTDAETELVWKKNPVKYRH